ncbi:MAG: heme a synthase, partial [Solirubrobacteraceae bacterium]|nr:heme a synthase [Solirubrobacteraceae bacterium]
MKSRLERLRARTNGYTVTPQQYAYTAYVALGALTLIVLSGAAVRLTGSGLGCPDWPKCYGNAYPPLNTHAVIEFSNRMITVPVSIAAGAAWVLALRRRPYRRDLMWLGALLPLGVVGQAVLGGFTVRGALDYGWVMGHFALSMLILLAAALLAWRAGGASTAAATTSSASGGEAAGSARAGEGGLRARNGAASRARAAAAPDRSLILSLRWLVALGALTIFAGTAA